MEYVQGREAKKSMIIPANPELRHPATSIRHPPLCFVYIFLSFPSASPASNALACQAAAASSDGQRAAVLAVNLRWTHRTATASAMTDASAQGNDSGGEQRRRARREGCPATVTGGAGGDGGSDGGGGGVFSGFTLDRAASALGGRESESERRGRLEAALLRAASTLASIACRFARPGTEAELPLPLTAGEDGDPVRVHARLLCCVCVFPVVFFFWRVGSHAVHVLFSGCILRVCWSTVQATVVSVSTAGGLMKHQCCDPPFHATGPPPRRTLHARYFPGGRGVEVTNDAMSSYHGPCGSHAMFQTSPTP